MIKIKNNIKQFKSQVIMASLLVMAVVMTSCDFEFDLPEEGSIADLTPPTASFEAKVSPEDNLKINFSNLSGSSTDYVWEFGDGNSSTDKEPSHTYDAIGTYNVMLIATDKLGVSNSVTGEVVVEEKKVTTPDILESGFEDGMLENGTGDGRDSWRISGGTIFGISGDAYGGSKQSAKFSSDGRVAYQALVVTPDTDYEVSFFYSIKTDKPEKIRLAILGSTISNADEAEDAIIASTYGDIQEGSKTFNELKFVFNSGDSSTIAIWMDTDNQVDVRVDEVKIKVSL